RHDAGELTRRALLVTQVVDPLGVHRSACVVEEPLLAGEMCVPGPAVFLTMRTVRWNGLQIAQVTPTARLPNSIQERVRTCKLADGCDVRMDKETAQAFARRFTWKSRNFHILVPVVTEASVPALCPAAFEDVMVGLEWLWRSGFHLVHGDLAGV